MLTETSLAPSTLQTAKQKRKYFIGIDPGRNTGIAIWSKYEKKLIKLLTLDFWGTINFLDTFKESMQAQDWGSLGISIQPEEIDFEVVMEDPQLNAPVFGAKGMAQRDLLAKAQRVGRNKEQAFLLIQYLENKKITFRTIRPVNRSKGGGKWTAEYFTKMSGWAESSNEHNRDAARFVIGL